MPYSEELKMELLDNARSLEICEGYNECLNAQTEAAFISAMKEFIEWGYREAILTESHLSQFSQSELNAAGIYNTGTHSIANTALDYYITGDANVTFALSNSRKYKIVVLGEANVTVALSGNTYARVLQQSGSSQVTLSLADNAACMLDLSGEGSADSVANDKAVFHCVISDSASLNYTGNNDSVANLKSYHTTQVQYALNDAAKAIIKNFDQSVITNGGVSL